MSTSESVTEFSEVQTPATPSSARVGRLVVGVGSCVGTDIVVPKLLHPFRLPPFSYVVNEC